MAASPIYAGPWASNTLVKTPDHGARRVTLFGLIYTHVKQGPIADCYAALPWIGDVWADDGFRVMDAVVDPVGQAGLGRIIVTTEYRIGYTFTEVVQREVQKPLAAHPRYNTGGAKALTSTDWVQIALWDEETSAALKADYHWESSSNTLSANAQDYVNKRSVSPSYRVFAPIARRVTNNWLILTAGACGTYSATPPFSTCPSGYVWIKIADSPRKDGAYYERTEEWEGVDYVDSDLYG